MKKIIALVVCLLSFAIYGDLLPKEDSDCYGMLKPFIGMGRVNLAFREGLAKLAGNHEEGRLIQLEKKRRLYEKEVIEFFRKYRSQVTVYGVKGDNRITLTFNPEFAIAALSISQVSKKISEWIYINRSLGNIGHSVTYSLYLKDPLVDVFTREVVENRLQGTVNQFAKAINNKEYLDIEFEEFLDQFAFLEAGFFTPSVYIHFKSLADRDFAWEFFSQRSGLASQKVEWPNFLFPTE